VSPRAGGEADKFGNRYEGRWTVRQLLEVLAGRAEAITLEPLGEISAGVEFTLEREAGTLNSRTVASPSRCCESSSPPVHGLRRHASSPSAD
jgi:hypothetical protein